MLAASPSVVAAAAAAAAADPLAFLPLFLPGPLQATPLPSEGDPVTLRETNQDMLLPGALVTFHRALM